MYECPTCGDVFDSDKGMKIHHKLSHNISLSKEIAECVECGEKFEYYPSDKKGLYCSSCTERVSWGDRSGRDDLSGSDNPNWSGGAVLVDCSNCGDKIEVSQYKSDNQENFFCNIDCMSKYREVNWQGKNHHLWEGGEIDNYGHDWSNVRDRARERDNFECVICSKSRDDIGYGPEVHHIKPVREFDDVEDAHTIDNVVSLCPSCHANAEHGNIGRDELIRKV